MQENVARQEDSGLGQGRERLFPSLCLDELELFLVKKLLSGGRLRALSALNRDRFLPCPSPPDPARVLEKDVFQLQSDVKNKTTFYTLCSRYEMLGFFALVP